MGSRLCIMCRSFKSWDLPHDQRWGGAKFPHHPTTSALRASAAKQCHLCVLIVQALLTSKFRDEDSDLPDRQIWLQCVDGSLEIPETRIVVSIEPESLSTAGSRHADGTRDILLITEDDDTVDGDRESIAQAMEYVNGFWISQNSSSSTFRRGRKEISEDLFWALANPYYEGKINLAPMPADVDKVLEECAEMEDHNTDSSCTFKLVSSWLQKCTTTHPRCMKISEPNPVLPTRVIDVGPSDGSKTPYVYISNAGERHQYAALSHRWGNTDPLTTTTQNLVERRLGLPSSEMSQTFRDAITIARNLGVRYLWIDSLCILQDSFEDWALESSRMGAIYRKSLFTIAAVEAEDSTSGCFASREGLLNRPCKLRLDVKEWTFPQKGEIYALSARQSLEYDIWRRRGPLDTRRWVLQEQLLPPRIINYTKGEVYWDCMTQEISERNPDGLESGYRQDTDYIQSFKAGIGGFLGLQSEAKEVGTNRHSFHRAWHLLVQEYTCRGLTKESDTMAALYGIITEMQKATGDVFLIGLWQQYIWMDLLWCSHAPGCPIIGSVYGQGRPVGPPSSRATGFTTPSWSWMSITGHIRYTESDLDFFSDHTRIASIPCVQVEPSMLTQEHFKGVVVLDSEMKEVLALPWQDIDVSDVKWPDEATEPPASPIPSQKDNVDFTSALMSSLLAPISSVHADGKVTVDSHNLMSSFRAKVSSTQNISRAIGDWEFSVDQKGNITHVNKEISLPDGEQSSNTEYPFIPGSLDALITRDLSPISLSHILVDPTTRKTIGLWAPDVTPPLPRSVSEGASTDLERHMEAVTFAAISKSKGFVWGLLLEPTEQGDAEYRRIGLGWWSVGAWERGRVQRGPLVIV